MGLDLRSLLNLAVNVLLPAPNQTGDTDTTREPEPEVADLHDLDRLKYKDGGVITILGRPNTGKTVLARRLAELLERPAYIISPEADPPPDMDELQFGDLKTEPPPRSTLVLDDALGYLSGKDWRSPAVRQIEALIPTTRHKRKIYLIIIAQGSALLDKYALAGDMVFLKPPDLLFGDTERSAVKKYHERSAELWEGRSDWWIQRHVYAVGHSWEGLVRVQYPGKEPASL